MSARMQVPLSQRRHTNVAVVRYTKNGVKLEIACYKNKVISYRSGVETCLDEVLQVERVFTNVSRGLYASEKEIQTVFGKGTSEKEALKYILDHGELQIAQQERTVEKDKMFIDIAVIISQKCVNKVTQRPFPVQVIEQALRSLGATVKPDQPVKKQALALIYQLINAQIIPIARAQMKLRCIVSEYSSLVKLVEWCETNEVSILERPVNTSSSSDNYSLLILLQPHLFREIEKFLKDDLAPGCTLHVVESAAMNVAEAAGLDAQLIARANAHATGADGVGSPGTSHTFGSTGLSDDCGRSKKKGKENDRKKKSKKHALVVDNEDQGTTITTDISSAPAALNDDGDGVGVALSKLKLNETCTNDSNDDDDKKGRRSKKKAKRRQEEKQQQQSTGKKEVNVEALEASDDELLVNRKQRRQAAAKARNSEAKGVANDDDEFGSYDYDYMEEHEEAEKGEIN